MSALTRNQIERLDRARPGLAVWAGGVPLAGLQVELDECPLMRRMHKPGPQRGPTEQDKRRIRHPVLARAQHPASQTPQAGCKFRDARFDVEAAPVVSLDRKGARPWRVDSMFGQVFTLREGESEALDAPQALTHVRDWRFRFPFELPETSTW